jgi:sodium/hydrogen exchanger 8
MRWRGAVQPQLFLLVLVALLSLAPHQASVANNTGGSGSSDDQDMPCPFFPKCFDAYSKSPANGKYTCAGDEMRAVFDQMHYTFGGCSECFNNWEHVVCTAMCAEDPAQRAFVQYKEQGGAVMSLDYQMCIDLWESCQDKKRPARHDDSLLRYFYKDLERLQKTSVTSPGAESARMPAFRMYVEGLSHDDLERMGLQGFVGQHSLRDARVNLLQHPDDKTKQAARWAALGQGGGARDECSTMLLSVRCLPLRAVDEEAGEGQQGQQGQWGQQGQQGQQGLLGACFDESSGSSESSSNSNASNHSVLPPTTPCLSQATLRDLPSGAKWMMRPYCSDASSMGSALAMGLYRLGFLFFGGLLANCVHQREWHFVPESGVMMILGVIFAGVSWALRGYKAAADLAFDPVLLSLLLLPPIVFEAGYSLRQQNFALNFGTIVILAVVGTVLCTLLVGVCLHHMSGLHLQYFPDLTRWEALMYGALISAVDPVATLGTFKALAVDPNLEVIIFGESLLNDAVAIVLFKAFGSLVSREQTLGFSVSTADAVPIITGDFFKLSFGSTAVGLGVGTVVCLAFKYNSFRGNVDVETLTFLFGTYAAYLLAELPHFSGILAALVCGMFCAHFTRYNLTHEGRETTRLIYSQLATAADMLIFFMTGMIAMVVVVGQGGVTADPVSVIPNVPGAEVGKMVVVQGGHNFSAAFLFVTLALILVTRAISILVLVPFINRGRRNKISKQHAFVMWWSGLRGAIAIGLAVTVPSRHRFLMISTTVAIVFITVFGLGGSTARVLHFFGVQMGLRGKRRERAEKGVDGDSCFGRVQKWWRVWERQHLRTWLVRESEGIARLRSHVQKRIKEGAHTERPTSSKRFGVETPQRQSSDKGTCREEVLIQARMELQNHDDQSARPAGHQHTLSEDLAFAKGAVSAHGHQDHRHHSDYSHTSVRGKMFGAKKHCHKFADEHHAEHEEHHVRGKWFPQHGHTHGGVGAVAHAERATVMGQAQRRVQERSQDNTGAAAGVAAGAEPNNPLTMELVANSSSRGGSGSQAPAAATASAAI